MKKSLSNQKNIIFFCILFVLPLFSAASADYGLTLRGLKNDKKENNRAVKLVEKAYSYTLAPDKAERTGEYTRKEVESFLCACIADYIQSKDTYKAATDGTYLVRSKTLLPDQKEEAGKQEIRKWFEDKVTVTSGGNVTALDTPTIKQFFAKINQVVGTEKFIYNPDLEVANIVIELAPPNSSTLGSKYLGESILLDDDLRVRLTMANMKVNIQTFKAGAGRLINKSRQIRFTPREDEFRRDHRLVKVYISNILDPLIRRNSLVHELLHAIGFSGHSPYFESNLFPLPVLAYPGYPGGLTGPIITPLAERMTGMLYRTEILPGMSIKEAGEVLSRLKHKDRTPKSEIIAYLSNKKRELEAKKKALLEQGKNNFDNRMALYIELDKWVRKEQWFLEELKEIEVDYKIDTKVVKKIKEAASAVEKLTRLRTELILVESTKRKILAEAGQTGGKLPRSIRRQIKLCDEQIVVLKDLLNVAREIERVEQEIETAHAFKEKEQIEEELRRVLRQLYTIEGEKEFM